MEAKVAESEKSKGPIESEILPSIRQSTVEMTATVQIARIKTARLVPCSKKENIGARISRIEGAHQVSHAVIKLGMEVQHAVFAVDGDPYCRYAWTFDQK